MHVHPGCCRLSKCLCTANSLPSRECMSRCCRACTLPHLPSSTAFTIRTWSLHTGMAAELPKVAAKVWQSKRGASETELNKLTSQLEAQRRQNSNLLALRTEGEISLEEFRDANSEWKEKIFETEGRIRTLTAARATRDFFVRFAELQLTDLANV